MTVDTKQRILDVAERMFAEHGYEGASLRGIIAEAGVNLAAVHYHFRSKEALLEAVLLRRMIPLNQERLDLLDQVERNAKGRPSLEAILQALIGPTMRLILNPTGEGRTFGKLMGRLHSENAVHLAEILKRHVEPAAERFREALASALPDLSREDLGWRTHFAMGALVYTLSCWDRLEAVSLGWLKKPQDPETIIPALIGFVAAGFRAPTVHHRSKQRVQKEA